MLYITIHLNKFTLKLQKQEAGSYLFSSLIFFSALLHRMWRPCQQCIKWSRGVCFLLSLGLFLCDAILTPSYLQMMLMIYVWCCHKKTEKRNIYTHFGSCNEKLQGHKHNPTKVYCKFIDQDISSSNLTDIMPHVTLQGVFLVVIYGSVKQWENATGPLFIWVFTLLSTLYRSYHDG